MSPRWRKRWTRSALKGTQAGLRTIQTRTGEWKSWDPDVYGVDEATEGGYIARLKALRQTDRHALGGIGARGDQPRCRRGTAVLRIRSLRRQLAVQAAVALVVV